MTSTINILHITDTHIKESNKDDVKMRIDSLINYLIEEKLDIDLLAFTGDLAFSGEESEYELFDSIVLIPLKTRLKLNSSKVLLIPGNHDVCRTEVKMPEHQRLRKLNSSRAAENEIKSISTQWGRLSSFQNYQNKYLPRNNASYQLREHASGLFSSRVFVINGVTIGIACLNSAWLCIDDEDQHKLFLSEYQIRKAVDGLNNCNLKIALCHHPLDWLHNSETHLSSNDLKREFQMILTGHLHRPISVSTVDTSSNSINLTGRAIFDGKIESDVEDGFHIYQVNVPESKITALFRKYIRKRNTYDRDTDHAQGGEHEFVLQVPIAVGATTALVAHKLASSSLVISKEIHSALSQLQGTETPVFVSPKMRSFKLKGGIKKTVLANVSIIDLFDKSVVICGGQDSGKTILLKTIAAEVKQYRKNSSRSISSIYLSPKEIPESASKADFNSLISKKLDCNIDDLIHLDLTISIDSLGAKSSDAIAMINEVCVDNVWHFVVVVSSMAADAMVQDERYKNITFVEVQAWGPSRIREFANKLFSDTEVNAEHAFKFVSECLRTVDLPATPTIVSLYMSIFPKAGSQISSLSFLRLLEKIEQIRLGSNEPTSVDSLYNRRKILQSLALLCLDSQSLFIEVQRLSRIISEFFIPKKLSVDIAKFLMDLVSAGILRFDDEMIGFSNFAFFDYYIALCFKEGLINSGDYTCNLLKCERVTSALSLFAGLERENIDLVHSLIEAVEKNFMASGALRLADLDAHISGLLIPEDRKASQVDEVASESLSSNIDYDEADENYDSQKRALSANRDKLLKQDMDESVSDLSKQIGGLHSFYSIFKNLENIDGEWKEMYLDRILDYHITTNFSLIDFYVRFTKDESFRTLAAYILTWTGHGFMSSSMGNPTLSQTICDLIDNTKNDFKKFLLLLLLSELRDSRALDRMELFSKETESRAATEILYLHVRNRLVSHEERAIPVALISLFKSIYIIRQTKFKGDKSEGIAKSSYDEAFKKVSTEHWKNYRDLTQISSGNPTVDV